MLGVLLLVGHTASYSAVMGCSAAAAATAMAVGDVRIGLLRNSWTGPFAIAAIMQAVIAAFGPAGIREHLISGWLGAFATIAAYFAMGLIGWVGMGDVKFVIGLAIFSGVLAGAADFAIAPISLILSAAARAARGRKGPAPHGPALAAAFGVVVLATLVTVPPGF